MQKQVINYQLLEIDDTRKANESFKHYCLYAYCCCCRHPIKSFWCAKTFLYRIQWRTLKLCKQPAYLSSFLSLLLFWCPPFSIPLLWLETGIYCNKQAQINILSVPERRITSHDPLTEKQRKQRCSDTINAFSTLILIPELWVSTDTEYQSATISIIIIKVENFFIKRILNVHLFAVCHMYKEWQKSVVNLSSNDPTHIFLWLLYVNKQTEGWFHSRVCKM